MRARKVADPSGRLEMESIVLNNFESQKELDSQRQPKPSLFHFTTARDDQ